VRSERLDVRGKGRKPRRQATVGRQQENLKPTLFTTGDADKVPGFLGEGGKKEKHNIWFRAGQCARLTARDKLI